jgi:histidinol-phosphate aminotransferase
MIAVQDEEAKHSLIERFARAEVVSLPAYNAGLSSQAVRERYGATRIARLASNENPFGASPAVAKALADLAAQIHVYPDANCTALREAIAKRVGVAASEVVVGNGSENLLEILCQAFLAPGDRVLTLAPSFGLHEIYPRMMGARVETVPLTPALTFDVDAWCAAVARRPKMVMLSNPSNPVGCVLDAEGFERLLAATPAGTMLVIDEAYHEYALHAPGFPDALAMLRAQQRPWIVLRTFSKAWGLAGLRVGYGIASDARWTQLLGRVRTPFNVNQAAQIAALAAWGDPTFMQHAVARTVARRGVMESGLRSLGLRFAPSAANFLFVDLGRPNGPVNEALLAHGIIVKPWKEPGFETFLRVSAGAPEDNQRFLDVLGDVVAA